MSHGPHIEVAVSSLDSCGKARAVAFRLAQEAEKEVQWTSFTCGFIGPILE
jgi:hypothetical protein